MFVAGVDVGSLATKALILDSCQVAGWNIVRTGPDGSGAAANALAKALGAVGIPMEDVANIVSTGYGRVNVPFAQSQVTEISCHARGVHWLFPRVRTILDVGGQDCKAIRCDERGRVTDFVMNDRCAAGTGRFLERVADTMQLPLEEMGSLSLQLVEGVAPISSVCTVFAQIDVLRLLREGRHINDVLAGVLQSLAVRLASLVQRVGAVEPLAICGGVAKNEGVVKRLEEILKVKAIIPQEPQIVGALGAALFARDKLLGTRL